jgi:hypothetical protein
LSSLDDVLADLPPERLHQTEDWEFTASTGRKFPCRIPRDADAIEKLLKRGKTLEKLDPKKAPAVWKGHLPLSPTVAEGVALLSACIADPKATDAEWAKLAKTHGAFFLELVGNVKLELLGGHVKLEQEEIDELGEGSGETEDASSA